MELNEFVWAFSENRFWVGEKEKLPVVDNWSCWGRRPTWSEDAAVTKRAGDATITGQGWVSASGWTNFTILSDWVAMLLSNALWNITLTGKFKYSNATDITFGIQWTLGCLEQGGVSPYSVPLIYFFPTNFTPSQSSGWELFLRPWVHRTEYQVSELKIKVREEHKWIWEWSKKNWGVENE